MSYILGYPSNYTTPSAVGTVYELLNVGPYQEYFSEFYGNFSNGAAIVVRNKNGIFSYYINYKGEVQGDNTFIIAEGNNEVDYEFYRIQKTPGAGPNGSELTTYKYESSTFTIYGVENRYPLLPYTVNDVIQRVLQLVEPLRKNETPRFSFTPPTGAKSKIFSKFSPEFTFTRNTLREALQQIGGYIHAEPRLKPDMSLDWDFYGEEEKARYTNYKTDVVKDLSLYKYRTLQRKRNLDETANALDSYQQNLVNRVNYQKATTATPFEGGFQSLRMETAWVRAAEENEYHAETAENIDRIVKVEMLYNGETGDITPYVYDKKVYDNLSGIAEVYPNAKVTSLYYTQGQKGIYGLFYKNPSAWGNGIGKNYAIVNIYNYVFEKNVETLTYTDIQFRITYVPIYSTRVQQTKQYVQDFLPLPRTINYTQSENSVETAYFGENIKGAIARMGNAEKNITMNFRNLDNIPKAGLLFDDDYYIAEVSTAVLIDHFEVTLGLSKNFNRKSKYIGASSIKRIYEVSEEQVQERHTVLQEYLLITEKTLSQLPTVDNSNGYLSATGLTAICRLFNGGGLYDYHVSAVSAFGTTYNGANQERVLLPVISSAFGNTLEFTWRYKDNFSAGYQAIYEQSGGGVSGMFTVETEYTDYYGRLYYYQFSLGGGISGDIDGDLLPQTNVEGGVDGRFYATTLLSNINNPIVLRKDSREALKFTYALNFVADDKSIVLGSALTANNPLITYETRRPHLYLLRSKINRFSSYLDLANAVDLGEVSAEKYNGNYIGLYQDEITGNLPIAPIPRPPTIPFVAWAYAYPIEDGETQIFENENGEKVEVPTQTGGELIIGKNVDIQTGDIVGNIGIYYLKNIYDYYDWLKKNN